MLQSELMTRIFDFSASNEQFQKRFDFFLFIWEDKRIDYCFIQISEDNARHIKKSPSHLRRIEKWKRNDNKICIIFGLIDIRFRHG